MLFPLWKLVNQLQRQFPYTVWCYCVWPGHLISISSCWEQRVNFISSLSLMQTAWEAPQGQLEGSPAPLGGRMRASRAGLATSVSIPESEAKILLLTETLANSPVQAYFLKAQRMWDYFFLFLWEILQTQHQIQFKQNKCLRTGKKKKNPGWCGNILEPQVSSYGFHFCLGTWYTDCPCPWV